MKIVPDKVWAKGDKFERGGKSFSRNSTLWRLDSGLDDRQPMANHIIKLLDKLEPHEAALSKVAHEYLLQFVCVAHSYQSFSWELDLALQKRATALGISFWFDIYPMGDIHEEISELREQASQSGILQRKAEVQ